MFSDSIVCHLCLSDLERNYRAYTKCCKKKCKKVFCRNCIIKDIDPEFIIDKVKPDTWICYSCGERCPCQICKKKNRKLTVDPQQRRLFSRSLRSDARVNSSGSQMGNSFPKGNTIQLFNDKDEENPPKTPQKTAIRNSRSKNIVELSSSEGNTNTVNSSPQKKSKANGFRLSTSNTFENNSLELQMNIKAYANNLVDFETNNIESIPEESPMKRVNSFGGDSSSSKKKIKIKKLFAHSFPWGGTFLYELQDLMGVSFFFFNSEQLLSLFPTISTLFTIL
jgi:hypothetical protein